MEWTLEDVELANRENADSFFIPTLERRQNQKKGDLVRLHFVINNPTEDGPRAERMWVEITNKKLFSKIYVGTLTNQPVYIKSLNVGDIIEFRPMHIARIIIKKDDPLWLDIGEKVALVSKKCLDEGWIFRWMYRENADREEDSGWRIFEGTESDEYNSDAKNISRIKIYYLLDKDPTLIIPFKRGYGSAFERNVIRGPWVEVNDWDGEPD